MNKEALLLIDIQNIYFTPGAMLLHKPEEAAQENGIKHLIVAGMMSHMCIDTTVRACQDYGYEVTVIEDACTTMALKYGTIEIDAATVHAVYMASLGDGFADVMKLEDSIWTCGKENL